MLFTSTGTINGDSATIGPMNFTGALPSSVGGGDFIINWTLSINGGYGQPIGTSQNLLLRTIGPPNADEGFANTPTAKRMNWTAAIACQGCITNEEIGNGLKQKIFDYTDFGGDIPPNSWTALDKTVTNGCGSASLLAVRAALLLGISPSETNIQPSWASYDETEDPDFPSDVTTRDIKNFNGQLKMLYYTDDGGTNWWDGEGSFRIKDGTTWKYWTVFPLMGPFTGTGADDIEKDKSSRYQILNQIRTDKQSNFFQKWDREGAQVPLP